MNKFDDKYIEHFNTKKIDLCDGCFTIKEIAFITELGQAFCKECIECNSCMKEKLI